MMPHLYYLGWVGGGANADVPFFSRQSSGDRWVGLVASETVSVAEKAVQSVYPDAEMSFCQDLGPLLMADYEGKKEQLSEAYGPEGMVPRLRARLDGTEMGV